MALNAPGHNAPGHESGSSYASSSDTYHSTVGGALNGVHKQRPRRRAPSKEAPSGLVVRWLIESSYCARVLGSGGSRLRTMRELCREPGVTARISSQLPNVGYRVFSCSGSALSVAKLAGLMTRAICDEPELERSDESSRPYELKLLVPRTLVPTICSEDALRQTAEHSHAALSCEPAPLPDSDEHVLHIYGVADAIQIAMYHCAEALQTAAPSESALYEPVTGQQLHFSCGHERKRSSIAHSNAIHPNTTHPNTTHSNTTHPNAAHPSAAYPNAAHLNAAQPYTIQSPVVSSPSSASPYAGSRTAPAPGTHEGLKLPHIEEDPELPSAVFIAYDIARSSKSEELRQIIRIDPRFHGTPEEFEVLLSNIKRVTACRAELDSNDPLQAYLDDDERPKSESLVLCGAPEENMLALFLLYRFLKHHKKSRT